ncbi:MAG: hypothetical protein IJV99_03160, partial [Clostridia bacterium]|nr:hypothetical protein [Clostridia bacterium]
GENTISGLKNGDRFPVKAIPSEDRSALDSDYSEVYTVVDQRTVLNTPIVTFNEESFTLEWQVVENAVAYRVYNALTGEVVYEYHGYNSCSIEIGKYYTVKAIPADYQTYAPSISAQVDCRVKLDAPEITIESEVVRFSSYKIGARVTYVYIINDGEEQTTTKQMVEIELNSGDTIKVKATCPSVGYTDSDWAQATR